MPIPDRTIDPYGEPPAVSVLTEELMDVMEHHKVPESVSDIVIKIVEDWEHSRNPRYPEITDRQRLEFAAKRMDEHGMGPNDSEYVTWWQNGQRRSSYGVDYIEAIDNAIAETKRIRHLIDAGNSRA